MAYKKYIKRNGKLYGPYIYHSRRVNGKVMSEYRGVTKRIDYKKFIFIFFGVVFILGVGYGMISNKIELTGNVAVDLDAQDLPQITNLTVIQLHEINESPHKYDLNLGVSGLSNSSLDYAWAIDCGYFFVDNKSVGIEYSGQENVIEWYTTGECADAVVKVSAIGTDTRQELVQFVFNSENRTITNISLISSSEKVIEVEVIEETNIIENEKVDTGDTIVEEVVPETIKIIEDVLPLSDEEKQILIDEFGNESIKSEVKSFKDRIIVRYEFGGMWIENSYDSDLVEEELEEQMEDDRIKWLRDIIDQILKEETPEYEIGEGSYFI